MAAKRAVLDGLEKLRRQFPEQDLYLEAMLLYAEYGEGSERLDEGFLAWARERCELVRRRSGGLARH